MVVTKCVVWLHNYDFCNILLPSPDVILRTLGEGTFGKVVCCKDK